MPMPKPLSLPTPLRYTVGALGGFLGMMLCYWVLVLSEEPSILLGTALGFLVAWLITRDRMRSIIGAMAAVTLVAPFFLSAYNVTQIVVLAIVAIGLNIVTGYAGQISLGHGALVAVGAYTTAILVYDYDWVWWWTIPVAALLATGVGFVVGLPSLRLSGPYLAMATLAMAIVLPMVIKSNKTQDFTHGVQGIQLESLQRVRECHRVRLTQDPETRCPTRLQDGSTVGYYFVDAQPSPPEVLKDYLGPEEYRYFVSLAIAAVMVYLANRLVRSRHGRAFVALRDSEVAAQVMGISLARYKTVAFAVSAFFAGVGGALYAVSVGFVSPDNFSLSFSLAFLVMIVLGGLQSILGSVLGAAIVWLLQLNVPSIKIEVRSIGFYGDFAPQIVYGLVLILVMIFMPHGLVGFFYNLPQSRFAAWLRRITPRARGLTPATAAHGGASASQPGAAGGSPPAAPGDQPT
jgi:branched-chain amino acid transport system permease protein